MPSCGELWRFVAVGASCFLPFFPTLLDVRVLSAIISESLFMNARLRFLPDPCGLSIRRSLDYVMSSVRTTTPQSLCLLLCNETFPSTRSRCSFTLLILFLLLSLFFPLFPCQSAFYPPLQLAHRALLHSFLFHFFVFAFATVIFTVSLVLLLCIGLFFPLSTVPPFLSLRSLLDTCVLLDTYALSVSPI